MTQPKHIAIVGAGMAGVTCARTLVQAGHRVTVLEKSSGAGGRMATRRSAFGGFDHGAQYFTVRDARFARALQTVPGLCKPWSANTVRVLDTHGRVAAAGLPANEPHWVPTPGMNALVRAWAQPLQTHAALVLQARVTRIERDARQGWLLHSASDSGGTHHHEALSGVDAVLLAVPSRQASELLQNSDLAPRLVKEIDSVEVAPCLTLMLAYPQAMQPAFSTLGPQWNAARSTHHRIAWLARESSKPGRDLIERWTVQASAAWSSEHFHDDPARVQAKLQKAFAEVTGIRAEPGHAEVQRWAYAQTLRPLGRNFVWDHKQALGVCGDWCIGHRVENAFVSGLELALAVA